LPSINCLSYLDCAPLLSLIPTEPTTTEPAALTTTEETEETTADDTVPVCTTCNSACGGLTNVALSDPSTQGCIATCVAALEGGCFDLQELDIADDADESCYSYSACYVLLELYGEPDDEVEVEVPACSNCATVCAAVPDVPSLDDQSTLACIGVCSAAIDCFDLTTGAVRDPLPDADCASYAACAELVPLIAEYLEEQQATTEVTTTEASDDPNEATTTEEGTTTRDEPSLCETALCAASGLGSSMALVLAVGAAGMVLAR
jgi:hypothetical protein